ncbi:MAG: glycosyltransferase family 2 protein [Acidimicrobiales bacterium]
MPTAPLVTVGVPVYNGERYLARALDSLLAQTFDDFEIVICDNASQDSTPRICEAYAERDPRVVFHRNPDNIGLAGNYNRVFALARGDYFKWAAHDDWHSPQSLELTVKALEAHPAASLCATGVAIVDEDGTEVDRWAPTVDLLGPPAHQRMHRLLWSLGETHPMYGLLRSSALRQTRLMQSYVGSDRTMLSELSLLGPIVQIPDVVHYYTISATARRGYRPSLTYDPANVARLPLRTWRLIVEHLRLIRRSGLSARDQLYLAGSVLGRFGVRDARRLAAEGYYTLRILASRGLHRLRRDG